MKRARALLVAVVLGATLVLPSAEATWSIVLVDTRTREIVIGSATCLRNTNLLKTVPVVLVDVGAAAAQASVDPSGANRVLIRDELLAGTDPAVILQMLEAGDPAFETRQYGIVDVRGRAISFTGAEDQAYAGSIVGRSGSLVWAIQGNILTCATVIQDAEAAMLAEPGGLPEKLMAAMEAARVWGGDGRCSCSSSDPTCGCPPEDFTKSAHVGFMVGTRRGDIDGDCAATGCATGTYYLRLNYRGDTGDPDPVIALREMLDAFRLGLIGRTDAVESRVSLSTCALPPDGTSTATMTIELRDWQGSPAAGVTAVNVLHDTGSAGSSTIGAVSDLGGSIYQASITAGATPGHDVLVVQVTDAAGTRYLIPSAQLVIQNLQYDLNGDQHLDVADLSVLLANFGTAGGAGFDDGDLDGDGDVDLADLSALLLNFAEGCA